MPVPSVKFICVTPESVCVPSRPLTVSCTSSEPFELAITYWSWEPCRKAAGAPVANTEAFGSKRRDLRIVRSLWFQGTEIRCRDRDVGAVLGHEALHRRQIGDARSGDVDDIASGEVDDCVLAEVAVAEHEAVVAGVAGQNVVALAADQDVVAEAPVQPVVAVAAEQNVIRKCRFIRPRSCSC